EPIGQARILDGEEETLELLPPIYDRVQAETVGMLSRTPDWWKVRRLYRNPRRPGGEQVRVTIELDGRPEAYALYRLNFSARNMVSETTLEIGEAFGTSPRALAAIWRYLLGIDWIARIEASWLALDHPLFLWLHEPRRMRFPLLEALWVRLVDVGAALDARAFEEGSVVLDVRDEFCPWNTARWQIRAGAGTRTTAETEVVR